MRAEPTWAAREGVVARPQPRAELCSQPVEAQFCSRGNVLAPPPSWCEAPYQTLVFASGLLKLPTQKLLDGVLRDGLQASDFHSGPMTENTTFLGALSPASGQSGTAPPAEDHGPKDVTWSIPLTCTGGA